MRIPEGPRVIREQYYERPPFVMCRLMVSGDDGCPFGLNAYGVGFAKAERGDAFDESFGRKLARKRALAEAESEYYTALAEIRKRDRLQEAKRIVEDRYPKVAQAQYALTPMETADEVSVTSVFKVDYPNMSWAHVDDDRAAFAQNVEPTYE